MDVHKMYPGDGYIYFANKFRVAQGGKWQVSIGHDGGVRAFVDGKAVLCVPECINPAKPGRSNATLTIEPGIHEIVVAFDKANDSGWGIFFNFIVPKAQRGKTKTPAFPVPVDSGVK